VIRVPDEQHVPLCSCPSTEPGTAAPPRA